MSSLDTLLAALDTFEPSPDRTRADCYALPRGRLDLLLAASDADAVGALLQRSWLWPDVLAGSSSYCLWKDRPRLNAWLNRALRTRLVAAPQTPRAVREAIDQGEPLDSAIALGECLRQDILRPATSHSLRMLGTPEAWALLREHDGPDLAPDLRLAAALHDPVVPRAGLATFLGPGVDPALRRRSLEDVLRLPDPLLFTPDLVPLLEACLNDGVSMEPLLMRLQQSTDERLRRSVFGKLWSATQAGQPPLPWPDVPVWLVFQSLVRTAPAPDLLAVLLDAMVDPTWGNCLVNAIATRPEPHLIPAVTRWSRAHKTKAHQSAAQAALAACRTARSWKT